MRGHGLQHAIACLDTYIDGARHFSDSRSLADIIGPEHCVGLRKHIDERFGVRRVAGIIAVDSRRLEEMLSNAVDVFKGTKFPEDVTVILGVEKMMQATMSYFKAHPDIAVQEQALGVVPQLSMACLQAATGKASGASQGL